MLVSLGISSGFHDSSACLVSSDGSIIYAASEERYTRVKGDRGYPVNAIDNALSICLEHDLRLEKIILHEDFLRRPSSSFFQAYLGVHGRKRGRKVLELLSRLDDLSKKANVGYENIFVGNHHDSHAYSAIGTAPFEDGIVLVLDAIGEDCSGLIGTFKNRRLVSKEKFGIDKSLGLIYSLVTVYCGFRVLTGEYKVMGLAPYGNPIYVDELEHVFGHSAETLNIADIDIFSEQLRSKQLEDKLNFKPRDINSMQIRKCDADLAASVQIFLERRVCEILDNFLKKHRIRECNLALSGGVALNCKLNLCLAEKYNKQIKNIWAFPASGDAGSSVGACMQHYLESNLASKIKKFSVFLGCEYDNRDEELKKNLMNAVPLTQDEIIRIVDMLEAGCVGGIYQGKAEFGPRALGHRSIIASAKNPEAIRTINKNVKSREDFRPLAPVILRTNAEKLLELNSNCCGLYETMLCLARSKNANVESVELFKSNIKDCITPFSDTDHLIPSAVHLDGTARVQIIDDQSELVIAKILSELDNRHGVKALVNTSMNVRGEPICETLADSLNCFKSAGLDFLIVDGYILYRNEQNPLVMANFSTRVGID